MMRQHLLTAGSGSDSDAEVPTDHQQPHHQPQQPGQQQHHPQPNFQQAESVRPRSTLFTNAKTKTTLQRSGAVSPSDVNGSPRSVSHTGTPTPPPPQGSVFSPHRQHPSNPASPVDRARLAQSTAVTAPASTSSPVLPLATGSADVSAPGATAVKSYRCASGGPVRAQARPGAAFSSRGPRSAFAKSSSAELLTAVKEEPKSPVAVVVKEEPHQAPPPSATAAATCPTTTAVDSAARSAAAAPAPADEVATNAQRSFNADEESSHGLIHQAVQNLTLSVHSTTAREVNVPVASMFSANVIALLLKQSSPHRGHFSDSATVSDGSSSLQTALTRAAEMERGVPTSDLAKCLSGFDSDASSGSVSPWAIVTPQAVHDAFATTHHEGNAKILELFAVRMQGELAAHNPQQQHGPRSSPSSNSAHSPNEAMIVLREALISNTASGSSSSSSSPLDFWKSPEVVIAMTASVLQAYEVFQLSREESCESGTGGSSSNVASLGEAAHRLSAERRHISNTGGDGEFTIGQNAVSLARVIGEEIARVSAPAPTQTEAVALPSSPLSALFALCSAASPGVLNQSWKVLVNLCHGVALLKERLATMDGTLQPPTAPNSSVRDCNSLMADSDQLLALVLSKAAPSTSSTETLSSSTTTRKRSRDRAATMPNDSERAIQQPSDWERVLSLATSADFRHANAPPEQTAKVESEVHLTTRAAVMTSVVFVAVDALHTALVSFALRRVATIASETADIARGWLCHGTSSTVNHLFGVGSSSLDTLDTLDTRDSSSGASVNPPRSPPSEKELKTLKFYVAHAATIVRQAPELAFEIGGTTPGELTLSPPTKSENANDELPDAPTQRRTTAPLFDAAASISITVEHASRLAFSAVDAAASTMSPNAPQNEENDGMTTSDKVTSAATVCGMSIDDETKRAWARVRQELVVGIQPRIEAAVSAACSAVTKASASRSVGRSVTAVRHTSMRTKKTGDPSHSAHSISTAAMQATMTGQTKEMLYGSALVEDFVTLADHKAKRLDAAQRCLAAACDTVADAASPRPSAAMIHGASTTSVSALVGVKEEISRWERKQNAALSAFFTTCAVARDGVSLSGRGEWTSATSSTFAPEATGSGSAALDQSPSKRSRESDGKTLMALGNVSGCGGQEQECQPDQIQVRSVVAAVDAAVSTSIATLQALLLWLPGMAAAGLPPLPTSVVSSAASPTSPKASSGHKSGTAVPTENLSGCGYDVSMIHQTQWSVACDVESIAPAIRELSRHLPEGFFSSAVPLPVAKALPSEVPTAQRWWRAATAVLVDLDAVFVHAHKMIDADPTRTAFLTIELTILQRKTVSALFAVLLAALQVPDDASLERVVSLWLFWIRFSSQSSPSSSSTSSSSLAPAASDVPSTGPQVTSINEAMSIALQQSGVPPEALQSMVISAAVPRHGNVAAASSQASITSWLVAVHGKCKARAARANARALRKLAKTSTSPPTDATADVSTTGAGSGIGSKRAAGSGRNHHVAARMAASLELILKEASCFPGASLASNDQDAAPPMKSPCHRESPQKTTPASTVTSCAEVFRRAIVQADDNAGSIGVVSQSASSPATATSSPSSLETLRKCVNDFTNAASCVAAPTQCLTAASKVSLASTAIAALASPASSASPSLSIVTSLIRIVGVGRSTKSLFESWSQITSLAKAVPIVAPTTAAAVAWALKQQLLLLPSTFSHSATAGKNGHESTVNLSSAATSMMFEALVQFILSYAHTVLAAAHSLSTVKTPHELSVFCGLIVDFVTELSSLQFVFGHVLSFCLDESDVSRINNERDVKQVMEKLAALQQTITGQGPDSEASTTRGGVQSTVVRRAAGRFVAAMSVSHGQTGQSKSSPPTASSVEVEQIKDIRSVCASAVSNVSALAMTCGQLVEVLGSTSLTQTLGSRKATDALTALSKVDTAHCKAHHEFQTKSASPTSQGSQQSKSQQQTQQQKDKSFPPSALVTNTPEVKYAVSLYPQQSPVFVRSRGGSTATAEAALLQSVSVLTSFVLDPASLVFPAGSYSGLLPSGARSNDTAAQHKTAVFEGLVDTGTVDIPWRCSVPVSESSTLCEGSSKAALDALSRRHGGAFGTDSSPSSPGRHGSKESPVGVHAVAALFFDGAIGSFNSPLCPVFAARNMSPDASKKSGEEQLIVRSHGSSVAAFNAALFAAMASRAAYPLQQLIPTNPVLANVLVRSVEWQNAADSAPGVSAVASGASTLHLGCGPAPAFSPVTQFSAQIASQASALRTALTSMVTSPASSRGHNPFGSAVSPSRGHTHGNITAIASVLSDTLQSLHAVIAASTAPLRRCDLIEDLQQCLVYAREQHTLFKQISEAQTKSSSSKDVASISASPFLIASARAAALRHSAAKARAAAAAERSNARSLLPGSNTNPSQNRAAKGRVDGLFEIDKLRAQFAPIARNTPGGEVEIESSLSQQHDSRDRMNPSVTTAVVGGVSGHQGVGTAPTSSRGPDGVRSDSPSLIQKQDTLPPPPHVTATTMSTPFSGNATTGARVASVTTAGVPLPPNHAVMTLQQSIVSVQSVIEALDPRANQNSNASPNSNLEHGLALNESDAKAVLAAAQELQQAAREVVRVAKALQPRVAPASEIEVLDD